MILVVLLTAFVELFVATAVSHRAVAQTLPPVGGNRYGSDRPAVGTLLPDGAAVEVTERKTSGGRSGKATTGKSDCHWAGADGNRFSPYSADSGGVAVEFFLVCRDPSGFYSAQPRVAVLPLTSAAAVSPLVLAGRARALLGLPLPEVVFSPPLEDGDDFLLTGLETWIWVENWGPASRSATVGGVTATVTATPVRQEWDFDPGSNDSELEGGCGEAGTAWDPSRPAEAQHSGCTFTFRHSSAGRPFPYRDAYEAELTVVYEMAWTSNVGAGGPLGEVRRAVVRPVPVGEQQALNESGGTQQ